MEVSWLGEAVEGAGHSGGSRKNFRRLNNTYLRLLLDLKSQPHLPHCSGTELECSICNFYAVYYLQIVETGIFFISSKKNSYSSRLSSGLDLTSAVPNGTRQTNKHKKRRDNQPTATSITLLWLGLLGWNGM